MVTVDLKELRKHAGPAAQYLRSKLKGAITAKGTTLQIPDAKPRDVKQLLNKYLHHERLDEYRVTARQQSVLEVHVVRQQTKPYREDQEQGSPPTAPQVLPYMFPGNVSRTPVRKGRKRER